MVLPCILIVLSGLFIGWEDLRNRAVYWFWFPVLLTGLIWFRHISNENLAEIGISSTINLSVIALQLGLLSLYLLIKQGKPVALTSGFFCWGDILFLGCMAFYFQILGLMVFMVSGLLLVVTGWAAYQFLTGSRDQYVPLAGLLSLLFLINFGVNLAFPSWSIRGQEYLLNLLG